MSSNEIKSAGNERIAIAYILDNFIRAGGTERQLAMLIENLDRKRFTPYVFNLRPKINDAQTDINCDVEFLNVTRMLSFTAIKTIFKVARMLKERRVKILQLYFLDSRVIGTLAGKLARVDKIIFCRREMGWWHTPLKLVILRFLAKLSDFCLVNAECVKEMTAASEKFPRDKIEVIYNGVEKAPESGMALVSKADFNIPEDAPIIGHIANLRPLKRIDRLLMTLSKLNNRKAHVLIIGMGEMQEYLEDLAVKLKIRERVHFHYTTTGMREIIRLFDVGVLASESEGLSNVLIEYASCGIPSVAFDIGGNNEIIADGETGYIIANDDINAMARRIDLILENPELAEHLGEKAKTRADNLFNVDTMVRNTENIYIKLLA